MSNISLKSLILANFADFTFKASEGPSLQQGLSFQLYHEPCYDQFEGYKYLLGEPGWTAWCGNNWPKFENIYINFEKNRGWSISDIDTEEEILLENEKADVWQELKATLDSLYKKYFVDSKGNFITTKHEQFALKLWYSYH